MKPESLKRIEYDIEDADSGVMECETESFLGSRNPTALTMTSKSTVSSSLSRQRRWLLCFGAVLATMVYFHFIHTPRDQLLYADVVDRSNTTIGTTVTAEPESFDFMSLATSYFTPDFPTHKLIQIQNYKTGNSIIVNFHITHHAGTTLCSWARSNGPVAPFACMGGNVTPPDLGNSMSSLTTPWYFNETDYWIQRIRPVFHYISWEHGRFRLRRSLNDTNWEHPRLVSIIVMRHPMDRLLTDVGTHYVKNGTSEEWWDYARHFDTNNYALKAITSHEGCCDGENTPDSFLETAKSYLERFTFIIDMDCFDESLKVLSSILGLNDTAKPGKHHPSARERVNNDTLYDYLVRRNTKDIELYKWAKERSLVKCEENSTI
ncbi:hypothetical protein MHU86_15781 [Fragilaria crotonensis]|nr:hypothetical protein MHU86_15781 [Fragilaria crotonensis]